MNTQPQSRAPGQARRAGRRILQGLLLGALGICAGTPALAGWELQWIDPFDGSGVDWNNWTAQTQANYNAEIQCYTADDTSAEKNYDVSGGTLTIIARKKNLLCPGTGLNKSWTSGRLNSKDKQEFLYGRLEARIRFLTQPGGTWPAFWMLENRINEQPVKGDNDNIPWPNPGAGEIDVWEWFSNNPNSYITNFYNASGGCSSASVGLYNYPNGFNDVREWHDYAIEWDANVARFYIDDINFRTVNLSTCNQYQEPMFVLLNVAIGGTLGGAVDGSLTEARMQVDYVAHCSPTTANSATRCNESTPGKSRGLNIFSDSERADWIAWDSTGGTMPSVVADDPPFGQVVEFDIVGSTVVGFTTRTTGGPTYDASGIVDTGTLEFDLKMTLEPLAGPVDWFLKLESGDNSKSVEVDLSTGLVGTLRPALNTWQHYRFKLSDLDMSATLDLAAIDAVLVFPQYGNGNGARFRIDNVEFLSNVAQNPVVPADSGDSAGSSGGGGGGGGGGSGPPWLPALGLLLLARRAGARPQ